MTQRSSTGGLDSAAGWLVVAATFVSTFTVFGVSYSFGAFFAPMAEEFGSSRSATALFFSFTTFLYFLLGAVTGAVADRLGPRPVLLVGAVALVGGLLATSRVESLWVGYLTYGVGVGIGVACAYVPMVAAVGAWFDQRRTTALGVAVAGIGVGTLVVAPLAEALVEARGWRGSYRLMALGAAGLLGLAAIGARRPPGGSGATKPPSLVSLVRGSSSFAILYVSVLGTSLALFTPFVFLDDYLVEVGVDRSAGLLVGLIGLCSVVGRLALGSLGARYSVDRLYQGCFAVMGLSYLIWYSSGDRYGQLVVFAIVLGVAYGGFIALSPAVAANHFGTASLGAVLGALYTAAGFGGLIGPPLAGALIDNYGYQVTLLVDVGLALCGFVVLTRLGSPRLEKDLNR